MSSQDNQKKKTFPLDEVSYSKSWKHQTVTLYASSTKKYELKGDEGFDKFLKEIDSYHNSKKVVEVVDDKYLTVPRDNFMVEVTEKAHSQNTSTQLTDNKSQPDIDFDVDI